MAEWVACMCVCVCELWPSAESNRHAVFRKVHARHLAQHALWLFFFFFGEPTPNIAHVLVPCPPFSDLDVATLRFQSVAANMAFRVLSIFLSWQINRHAPRNAVDHSCQAESAANSLKLAIQPMELLLEQQYG